jgi:hypothetical protein
MFYPPALAWSLAPAIPCTHCSLVVRHASLLASTFNFSCLASELYSGKWTTLPYSVFLAHTIIIGVVVVALPPSHSNVPVDARLLYSYFYFLHASRWALVEQRFSSGRIGLTHLKHRVTFQHFNYTYLQHLHIDNNLTTNNTSSAGN